jgi:hypothetical protein
MTSIDPDIPRPRELVLIQIDCRALGGEGAPGLVAIPVGAFADPDFPGPGRSGFQRRQHGWVEIVRIGIEHLQDD